MEKPQLSQPSTVGCQGHWVSCSRGAGACPGCWHGGDSRACPKEHSAEAAAGPLFPRLCDQRDVEFVCVEDQGPPGRARVPVGLVEQLEEPGSNVHGDPHDDAFGHP